MRRREILAGIGTGLAGAMSGCLEQESYTCLPSSRFDIVIKSDIHSPQTIDITVQPQEFGQEEFSTSVDVPPATNSTGITSESDVITHPREYRVKVTFNDETHTHTWRVTCADLVIRLHAPNEVWFDDGQMLHTSRAQ